MKQPIKREMNMDLLRILASFMIVIQHVSAYGLGGIFDGQSVQWRASNFYCTMIRCALPLFFMISGNLFLNREEEVPVTRLLKKNLLKLVLVYFFWLLFYAVDAAGGIRALGGAGMVQQVVEDAILNGKYHLWFFQCMIGIYLMIPVLSCLAGYENGKYLRYVFIVFVILGVLKTTVLLYPFSNEAIPGLINKSEFALSGYMGYFVVGAYLARLDTKKYKNRYLLAALLLVFLLHVRLGEVISMKLQIGAGIFYDQFCIFSFIEAVLVFVLFLRRSGEGFPEWMKKAVTEVSGATLGVYVMHIYFLEKLTAHFGVSVNTYNQWISIPAISIAVFGMSLAVALVMRRIPVLGKWLV